MKEEKKLFLTLGNILGKSILAIVLASIIVSFLMKEISKISNSIMENKKASFILEKRSEIIQNLKKDFQLVGDKDKDVEEALIPVDNILNFVAATESLANQYSLQSSIKFETPTLVSGNIYSINYSLILNGNIFTLINYIKSFEKLPYFSGIVSINYQSLTERGWEDNSSINIKGKIYVKQNNI